MSNHFSLEAHARDYQGKAEARRHRRQDHILAVIYGNHEDSQSIYLKKNIVAKAVESAAFHSQIIELAVDGNKQLVVLKDIQLHPNGFQVMHLDFMRINAKETLTMHVPIEYVGTEDAPGVKVGGRFEYTQTDLEIKCLPQNLPSVIQVDVSHMELDQTLHLSDVKLPKGVEFVIDISGDHDHPLVALHMPKVVVEEPVDVAEEGAEDAAEASEGDDAEKTESAGESASEEG